jgi:CBS domain-containing protein
MPVIEEDGTVIGIITELDILRVVNERSELARVTTGDIITPEVSTVKPETPITEVIKMMGIFHIIRLQVCKDEKLVGVIFRGNIIRNLVEPEHEHYADKQSSEECSGGFMVRWLLFSP